MRRRTFLSSLSSTLTASALAWLAPGDSLRAAQEAADAGGREFYHLRRYHLSSGPQRKLCDDYFSDALIPALNRMGVTPVGVFNVTVGPETPAIYLLMPSASLETLALVETRLAQDAEYRKAGEAFLAAPAAEPAFERMESWLLQAYAKMPRLTVPAASKAHSPRIFELRTYESPSVRDHELKVEMMQSGEAEIFDKAGIWQVFYGDTLIGARLPNLTYMLGFENMAERQARWAAFDSSPEWKALSSRPRYAFENIVVNITNIILGPTAYSQI